MTGKGPALHALEAVEAAQTRAMVARYHALMTAQGTEKYGSVRVDRAAQDARWLPSWFVLGQSADPVSLPWWADLAKTRPVDEVAQLDLECRAAWDDPRRRDAALATTGDALRGQYAWLRAVGWHSGAPRPAANELDRGEAAPGGHGSNSNAAGAKDRSGGRTADVRLAREGPAGGPQRAREASAARRALPTPPTAHGGY